MKALIQYDKKDGAAELRDIPIPEIGPGDVLVRVKAAGVCGADIEFFRALADNIRPPVVLGHEFCGVVEKTGANVRDWKPGDCVVSDNTGHVCGHCFACASGHFLFCPERLGLGYGMDGGFAEFARIPGDILSIHPKALMRLPDSLSFEEGAILEPSANSFMATVQEGNVQPGDIVVVFGPGPIGLFAVVFAAAAGAARVILVGGSRNRLDFGLKIGATDVVEYSKLSTGVPETMERLIGVNRADLVIDAAGAASVIPDAMRLVRPLGRIVKVAWTHATEINLSPLMFKGAQLKGHFGYDFESWEKILRLAEKKTIDYRPFISATFSLDQWREAFEGVEGKKFIKAVFNQF